MAKKWLKIAIFGHFRPFLEAKIKKEAIFVIYSTLYCNVFYNTVQYNEYSTIQ